MSRTLTLEATSPETFMDITTGINATQLRLKSYRVDLLASSTIPYRNLGIEIGNIMGPNYLIDQVSGAYLFRLTLGSIQTFTIDSYSVNSTFVYGCDIPLTMNGQLDKNLFMRIKYLDRTTNTFKMVPVADLKYLSLTFEVL